MLSQEAELARQSALEDTIMDWIKQPDGAFQKELPFGILLVGNKDFAVFNTPTLTGQNKTYHLDDCLCPTLAGTKGRCTKWYNEYAKQRTLDNIKDNLAGTLFVMDDRYQHAPYYYSDILELNARELRRVLIQYFKRCHNGWLSQGGSKILYRLHPDLWSRDRVAEDVLDAINAFTDGVPHKCSLTGSKSLLLHMPDHLINVDVEIQNMQQVNACERKTYSFYIRGVIRKGGFKSLKDAKLGAFNAYLLKMNSKKAFRKVAKKFIKNDNFLDESMITDEGKKLLKQFQEMFPESQGLISFGGFING